MLRTIQAEQEEIQIYEKVMRDRSVCKYYGLSTILTSTLF